MMFLAVMLVGAVVGMWVTAKTADPTPSKRRTTTIDPIALRTVAESMGIRGTRAYYTQDALWEKVATKYDVLMAQSTISHQQPVVDSGKAYVGAMDAMADGVKHAEFYRLTYAAASEASLRYGRRGRIVISASDYANALAVERATLGNPNATLNRLFMVPLVVVDADQAPQAGESLSA